MLQPHINYQFKSLVWRLEIDPLGEIVFAELRDSGDKKVYLKEDLEELEKQFPQDLKAMKQRAFNYLSRNPQDLANVNTNDLFESLKTEGFVATA